MAALLKLWREYRARQKLAAIVRARRQSFEIQDYAKRREAALKGRRG